MGRQARHSIARDSSNTVVFVLCQQAHCDRQSIQNHQNCEDSVSDGSTETSCCPGNQACGISEQEKISERWF